MKLGNQFAGSWGKKYEFPFKVACVCYRKHQFSVILYIRTSIRVLAENENSRIFTLKCTNNKEIPLYTETKAEWYSKCSQAQYILQCGPAKIPGICQLGRHPILAILPRVGTSKAALELIKIRRKKFFWWGLKFFSMTFENVCYSKMIILLFLYKKHPVTYSVNPRTKDLRRKNRLFDSMFHLLPSLIFYPGKCDLYLCFLCNNTF